MCLPFWYMNSGNPPVNLFWLCRRQPHLEQARLHACPPAECNQRVQAWHGSRLTKTRERRFGRANKALGRLPVSLQPA